MLRDRTISILKEHGIRLSKKQGQSHLVDEDVLERIVDYADLSPDDSILEIGSGIGNLTSFLLESSGEVIAIERDERLVEVLRDRFGGRSNLSIVEGDVLEIEIPKFKKVVANLPYSISSPVTFRLLDRGFDLAVLMYQKEFAQRMVASPGSPDYSRLSVNVSYRAQAEVLEEVSPNSFIPQPEVKSAIIRLRLRDSPFKVREEDVFFGVVRAAFQHRRKKIRNSLFYSFEEIFPDSHLSEKRKKKLIEVAVPEGMADMRPADLTPEEFGKLSDSLTREMPR